MGFSVIVFHNPSTKITITKVIQIFDTAIMLYKIEPGGKFFRFSIMAGRFLRAIYYCLSTNELQVIDQYV